jgi:lipocalin
MTSQDAISILRHCATIKVDEGREVVILHLRNVCADLRRHFLDVLSHCEFIVFCYASDLDDHFVLSIPYQSYVWLSARAVGLKCDLSKTRRNGYYVTVFGIEDNIEFPSFKNWFSDVAKTKEG